MHTPRLTSNRRFGLWSCLLRAVGLLLLVTAARPAPAQTGYTVAPLQRGAATRTQATAINENGDVVGWGEFGFPPTVTMRWDAAGNFQAPWDNGRSFAVATAAPIQGGVCETGDGPRAYVRNGFSDHWIDWWSEGPSAILGLTPYEFVGYTSDAAGRPWPRIWRLNNVEFSSAVPLPLEAPIAGAVGGQANAVNEDHLIAGRIDGSDGRSFATVWRGYFEHTPSVLATAPGRSSEALAVCEQEYVAGWQTDAAGNRQAHLWSLRQGTSVDLGVLPGHAATVARGVNDSMVIVGDAYAGGAEPSRAFLWTPQRGMQDLNVCIPPNSGWVLRSATAISDRGQITGWGEKDGVDQAFVLTPIGDAYGTPIVNAGPDQHLAVPHDGDPATKTAAIVLDGRGSWDPNGDAFNYMWRENGLPLSYNPVVTLQRPAGTYTFTLTVNDSTGMIATAQVQVIVDKEPNTAPAVKAGGWQEAPFVVHLSGGAIDADGDATSVTWSQSSQVIAPQAEVSRKLAPGSYTFTFTATDRYGAAGKASLNVSVKPDGAVFVTKGS